MFDFVLFVLFILKSYNFEEIYVLTFWEVNFTRLLRVGNVGIGLNLIFLLLIMGYNDNDVN